MIGSCATDTSASISLYMNKLRAFRLLQSDFSQIWYYASLVFSEFFLPLQNYTKFFLMLFSFGHWRPTWGYVTGCFFVSEVWWNFKVKPEKHVGLDVAKSSLAARPTSVKKVTLT